jgi:hypothetical protein
MDDADDRRDWCLVEDAPTMDWVLKELVSLPDHEKSVHIKNAIFALRTLTRQVKGLQSYVKELKEIILEMNQRDPK